MPRRVDDRYVYMRTVLGPRATNEPECDECSKPDYDCNLIPRRTTRDQGHSMQWPGSCIDRPVRREDMHSGRVRGAGRLVLSKAADRRERVRPTLGNEVECLESTASSRTTDHQRWKCAEAHQDKASSRDKVELLVRRSAS